MNSKASVRVFHPVELLCWAAAYARRTGRRAGKDEEDDEGQEEVLGVSDEIEVRRHQTQWGTRRLFRR